jgi:type III restriction enzyme
MVSSNYEHIGEAVTFNEDHYSYNQPYKGSVEFQKHLFLVVGDLDSKGEEHDSPYTLTDWGRFKTGFAIHRGNLIRFGFRHPPTGFIRISYVLKDGRILVVEYKGSDRVTAKDAQQKNLIGEIWAERSDGKTLFLMITDREFYRIANLVRG